MLLLIGRNRAAVGVAHTAVTHEGDTGTIDRRDVVAWAKQRIAHHLTRHHARKRRPEIRLTLDDYRFRLTRFGVGLGFCDRVDVFDPKILGQV